MNQTGPQAPMEATTARVYHVSGDVPVDDEVPMVPIVHRDQAGEKTRELFISLRCRFTHFAPYVLRLGVV